MAYDDDDDEPGFLSNFLILGGIAAGGWFLYKTLNGRAAAATLPTGTYPDLVGSTGMVNVTPPADPSLPRGIRNNNPGGIKFNTANNWDGQVGQDPDGFVIFSDPVYGIRAMFKLLKSYAAELAPFDIQTINANWTRGESPANQAGWIATVEAVSGLSRAQLLNVNDQGQMQRLADGIVAAENGQAYAGYYAGIEAQAWNMAA